MAEIAEDNRKKKASEELTRKIDSEGAFNKAVSKIKEDLDWVPASGIDRYAIEMIVEGVHIKIEINRLPPDGEHKFHIIRTGGRDGR